MRFGSNRGAGGAVLGLVISSLALAACSGESRQVEDTGAVPPAAPTPSPVGGALGLGTITANLDGEARTWFLAAGMTNGRRYASGVWFEAGGERNVSLGGMDTETPPLDTFEWDGDMPSSFGDYRGSAIQLLFPFVPDRLPYHAQLPSDTPGAMVSIIYMPMATFDPAGMYEVVSGSLDVTRSSLAGGLVSAEGTFSGTFERMGGGETVTITDGHFAVTGLPDVRTLGR